MKNVNNGEYVICHVASKRFVKKRLHALFASLALWHGLRERLMKMEIQPKISLYKNSIH